MLELIHQYSGIVAIIVYSFILFLILFTTLLAVEITILLKQIKQGNVEY